MLPVPMDGNCLFHSMLKELTRLGLAGDITTAHSLRTHLLSWVETHGNETECNDLTLSTWIELETEEDLDTYVRRLKCDGTWGGIIELYALTELYDVTTCVWEPLGHDSRGGVRYTRRHSLESNSAKNSSRSGDSSGSSERSETQSSPSSTASNDSDDKESRGELDHESSLRVPSGPTVHLHYNGCSHYCVFVPDVDEDQMMVPSPVRGRTLHPAGAPHAANPSSSASASDVPEHETQHVQPPCPAPALPGGPKTRSSSSSSSAGIVTGSSRGSAASRPAKISRPSIGAHPRSSPPSSNRASASAKSAATARDGVATVLSSARTFRTAHGGSRVMAPKLAASTARLAGTQPRAGSTHAALRRGSSHASSRTLADRKRPFGDLSSAVRLGLRFERGSGLPGPRMHKHGNAPREVRV